MANTQNQMSRIAAKTSRLPAGLKRMVLSRLFARIVPFLGTAGLVFEQVTQEKVVVSVKNRRKIQNHIKGVHATAMALLAETASGFVVGMNVPDDKLMLLKSMHVDYLKRSQGDMKATATLTPEQISAFFIQDKGEVDVKVIVTDESGEAPIRCQMLWVWVPKKRK